MLILQEIETAKGLSLVRLPKLPQQNNHRNISTLLDNLLRGYDNSIRPGFGGKPLFGCCKSQAIKKGACGVVGPPAVVEVDIMVRSMGPISEVDMVSPCETI